MTRCANLAAREHTNWAHLGDVLRARHESYTDPLNDHRNILVSGQPLMGDAAPSGAETVPSPGTSAVQLAGRGRVRLSAVSGEVAGARNRPFPAAYAYLALLALACVLALAAGAAASKVVP